MTGTGASGSGASGSGASGSGASGSGPSTTGGLVLLLVIAALVRIVGLLGPGFAGDVNAFVTWAEDAASHGLGAYYAAGGDSNYPPMLYLLWPLGLALDGGDLQFAIRALSIPFDLGLGALLFFVGRAFAGRASDGLLAAAFYLLNPGIVLTGPMWGQVDGMGSLPMVGALVAVARGRLVAAGALTVLAGLVKPQYGVAAFVLAGLVLFWLRSPEGIRRAAILGLAGLVTFVAVLAPLGMGPLGYLDLMGETFGRYRVHSAWAFNPWGMFFGFDHNDGDWFLVGSVLEIAAIGSSLWLLRWRRDLVGLLAVGSLIALTLYFVPTRAHERYLYGAIALLAPLAVMDPWLRRPFYALSATFLATIVYVLLTSPFKILAFERLATFPDWAISVMAAVTTASGVWVAWRLIQLLRRAEPNGPENASLPAEAGFAAAG